MRTKRNLIVGVAVIAAVMTLGLSAASAKPKATVTLHGLMLVTNKAPWDIMVANFERVYPNIHIETTYLASAPLQLTLLTQLQSGNAPDLIYMSAGGYAPTGPQRLADAGRLLNLSGSPWVKRYRAAINSVSYKGKVWAFPSSYTPVSVFYNTTLFAQLGLKVPTSFSQLLSICRRGASSGKIPFAFGAGPGAEAMLTNTLTQLIANTVYSKDPNWMAKRLSHKVTFAGSPLWRRLEQSLLDMRDANCFASHPEGTGYSTVINQMATGQALMVLSASALIPGIQAANPALKLSMFAMPADNPKDSRVGLYVSPIVGINSATKYPKEARTFLNFLGRPKQSTLFNKVAILIAPYDALQGKIDPWAKPIAQFLKESRIYPSDWFSPPNGALFNTVLRANVGALLAGQTSVAQILKSADDNFDAP